jgi:hypothetical protein
MLLIGLAACAGVAPEAMPTLEPTPTPSVTETVAAPTPPGSRVPLDCAQLFVGLDGFSVSSSAAREGYAWGRAVQDQSGSISCETEGMLGGTSVSVLAIVAPDVSRQTAQERADSPGVQEVNLTNLGGEISYSNCRAKPGMGYCLGTAWSGGYMIDYSIGPNQDQVAPDFDESFGRFAAALGSRLDSWAPPPAAWQAPEGALAWANDCRGDVAATDDAVRAAIPFEVAEVSYAGGDSFWLWSELERRVGVTSCIWTGAQGSASIQILPGAEWLFEQPGVLPGTPYDYPGALATVDAQESSVSLHLVVDASYVEVVLMDYGSSAPDPEQRTASARAIADAIVAQLGTS